MFTAAKIRILTVDDHPMLRSGIVAVAEAEPDMEVVAEASNGREGIEAFRMYRPDITLMDLQLPTLNGLEALEAILKEQPSSRIIVLTTYDGDVPARRALRAGVSGYLLKSMVRKELTDAIRIVHRGGRYISQKIASRLAEHVPSGDLSTREIEVLKEASQGFSNKMIAYQLCISEETVKGHMKNILSKLGVADRTHAFTTAASRGFFLK